MFPVSFLLPPFLGPSLCVRVRFLRRLFGDTETCRLTSLCWGSGDSSRLVTSSADQSVKLWDCETGALLHSFNFESPARAVSFSEGDKMIVITTDPFMEQQSAIHVKNVEADSSKRKFSRWRPTPCALL